MLPSRSLIKMTAIMSQKVSFTPSHRPHRPHLPELLEDFLSQQVPGLLYRRRQRKVARGYRLGNFKRRSTNWSAWKALKAPSRHTGISYLGVNDAQKLFIPAKAAREKQDTDGIGWHHEVAHDTLKDHRRTANR